MRTRLQCLARHLTRVTKTPATCPYSSYRQNSYDNSYNTPPNTSKKGVVVLAAGSLFALFGNNAVEELKKEIGTATMHLHQAEPHLAQPHFQAALKMLENDLERKKGDPIPDTRTVYLMDQLGNIALQLECYSDAVRLYLATINGLALNGIERSNRTVTELWLKVGQIYAILGDYRSAELSFMHCVEVTTAELSKTAENKNPDVIALAGLSYEGLGKVYLSMNHPENAINMYKHAIEFAERVLGENDSHVPVLLSDVATVYESVGRYDYALKYVDDAISRAKLSNATIVLPIMCNKATIVMYSGHLKEARELYMQLIDLCKERGDTETLREIKANVKILEEMEKELSNYEASN